MNVFYYCIDSQIDGIESLQPELQDLQHDVTNNYELMGVIKTLGKFIVIMM